MKTIELFAGIGGFRLAADSLGLKTIWANDLCSKASAVYRSKFGKGGFHEGDVATLLTTIPDHDVLTGGFPCQPFSSAGKKKGINDVRGTLFQNIVDILREYRPKYFVLENVKRLLTMERGLHFATILSSLAELDYTIEWRLLNAMDFGLAQNRQRVFITGMIGNEMSDEFGKSVSATRLCPEADLAFLSNSDKEDLGNPSSWQLIEEHDAKFPSWGMAAGGVFFGKEIPHFSLKSRPVLLREILQNDVGEEFDFTESTLKWLPQNTPVNKHVQGVEIISNQAGGARMGYTIFGIGGVAPTLTSTTSRHYERYQIGKRYRRLTNVEYARIQGFPDDHCSAVSVYDQYALIGNAVPPPMAEWVISRLGSKIVRKSLPKAERQKRLFEFEYANKRRT